MRLVISFLSAVAPALFLARHFYLKDKYKPEPKGLIIKVFLWGIASTLPILLLDLFFPLMRVAEGWPAAARSLFEAFIVAGLLEEFVKFQVVMRVAYSAVCFDEIMDGIVYTIMASLGFACLENILYVVGQSWGMALARALTAVPFHACCSGVMGYYIGRAKFAPSRGEEYMFLLKGLAWAVALHGLYDFLLFISPVFGALYGVLVVPFLLGIYKRLNALMASALREDAGVPR